MNRINAYKLTYLFFLSLKYDDFWQIWSQFEKNARNIECGDYIYYTTLGFVNQNDNIQPPPLTFSSICAYFLAFLHSIDYQLLSMHWLKYRFTLVLLTCWVATPNNPTMHLQYASLFPLMVVHLSPFIYSLSRVYVRDTTYLNSIKIC